MPSTRRAAKDTPDIAHGQHDFAFPSNSYLLITTPRHIFAYDSHGAHLIFHSRSGGIVAARAAQDGSGILAVASTNVVVMHDTKRGKEESWGLNAPQTQVRHLEYSPDSKHLFLSTTSDGTIQRFSTETSRLIDPAQKHDSAPVALAVSSTGHMLLSASHHPPVVYLKNLAHNTSPLHIQPNVSHSPVSSAEFHPERPNVFLLAFRDGTIAAYDATKMPRGQKAAFPDQQIVNDGEIGHISSVHRTVRGDDELLGRSMTPAPIAGVAFLPGFKTRAVTAGRDGKCKLIDFTKGGETLRTWHAKAPLTSLAVLSLKTERNEATQRRTGSDGRRNRNSASHTIGGPTCTDSIIAVSRVDGEVHLYDSVGLLLARQNISSQEERILNLEWVKGSAPKPSHDANNQGQPVSSVSETQADAALQRTVKSPNDTAPGLPAPEHSDSTYCIGKSPGLQDRLSRKLVLHPDELEEGTVRHTPSAKPTKAVLSVGAQYLDLFSPIQRAELDMSGAGQARTASPHKNRPRISSQTFVKSSEPASQATRAQAPPLLSSPGRNTSNSSSARRQRHLDQPKPLRRMNKTNTAHCPLAKSEYQFFSRTSDGSPETNNADLAQSREDAKTLAGLRRAAGFNVPQKLHGTLSSFANSQRLRQGVAKQRSPAKGRRDATDKKAVESRPRHEVHANDPRTWPTDSVSAPSIDDNDIWLTSDSDGERSQRRRRRINPLTRPPARQMCRSKFDSKGGVVSTTAQPPPTDEIKINHAFVNQDGSVEEEAFATANSHQSPSGVISPASEDIRGLFPRSSSLSPGMKKHHRSGPRRSPPRETTLTSLAVNAAFGRQPKSPWARLKAGKPAMKPVQVREDEPDAFVMLPTCDSITCMSCSETKARVRILEAEVAQLKGEVLTLKAVLRRSGVQCPPSLRRKR